uniref:Ribosomal RNA-processing protein 12-like conserved domain-containing protein n=1 Tax=Globodera rostochiensis TaxID=31243 RepID=A0A914HV11_GLORO
MVAKRFRIRAKGSSRSSIAKGGSSASNAKRTRHRDAARVQREAAAYPMVAVDERQQMQSEAALLDNVPMGNISLKTSGKKFGISPDRTGGTVKKASIACATSTILDQLPISNLSLLEDDGPNIDQTVAVELFEQLERALSVQNVKSWPLVIDKIAALLGKAGAAIADGTPSFARVMDTVAQFRDRANCPMAESIDRLFAVALQSVGMESLLSAVPLNVDVDVPVLPRDFSRSWLPPILAKNVRGDSLDFFARSLFPLTARLHQRLHELPELLRKLYTTLEHQIWAILPRCLANEPRDFHVAMPTLAPIMGAALNDRADLRLIVLRALRAALKFETKSAGICVMERYARNFLPILFGIYTATGGTDEVQQRPNQKGASIDGIDGGRHDGGAIRKSVLETIRIYVQQQQMPQQLLTNYVLLAVQKLQQNSSDGAMSEGQCLLADLLAALCRKAAPGDLELIFEFVEPFCCGRSSGRAQKKAYRILAEIYRRIEEPELVLFFETKRPFLRTLVANGTGGLNRTVFPWRIAIYRSVIASFAEFPPLAEFSDSISAEIVAFFHRSNNRSTRHQSALCLSEMTSALIRLALTGEEEISASSALCPLLTKLFGELKASKSGAEPSFQCTLIALNILAQKHCRLMDASLLAQLIAYASAALRLTPAALRPLPIRILRVLAAKMEQFMFDQFKELIIEAVFSQDTSVTTSRMRKANGLLLAQLLDRLDLETLTKFTGDRWVWQKLLKNIEKARRRKQRRRENGGEGEEDDDNDGGPNRERGGERASQRSRSGVETASAISWTTAGGRTAKADSIFDILRDSSDDELEEDNEGKGGGKRNFGQHKLVGGKRRGGSCGMSYLSVVIEDDEEEMLDLLDQKAMLQKVSLVREQQQQQKPTKSERKAGGGKGARKMRERDEGAEEEEEEGGKSGRKGQGPFRVNKEGKLLIADLDKKGRKRASNRKKKEGGVESEEGAKRRKDEKKVSGEGEDGDASGDDD